MIETELAYVAGFFDGEGSITITKNRTAARAKNFNHTMRVSIGNTDPTVVRWIHSEFGGSMHLRRIDKANHRDVYQWAHCTRGALVFLKAIRPFVRMKWRAVDLAIGFQETKIRRGPTIVSSEVLAWREAEMVALRALNNRGARTQTSAADEAVT